MDAALTVEEAGVIGVGDDGVVPDVGVQVEGAAAIATEGCEGGRGDVVAGEGEGDDEALARQRREQLAAVRVVVGAPDQGAVARPGRAVGRGVLRPLAPAEQVAVADRVVAGPQGVALPPELEQPLGDAALVAGIRVYWPPALGRAPLLSISSP